MSESYYFGTGTRRHIAKKREGAYVWLWCGMSGFIGRVFPTSTAPNCKHCIRASGEKAA